MATRKKASKAAEEALGSGLQSVRPAHAIQSVAGTRLKKFIEKYIVVPEGMLAGQSMKLLPEQEGFIRDVYDNVDESGSRITRRGIFSIARKNGKGLALDTPIVLQDGSVTTMGELKVGDHVLGRDKKPTRVVFKSEVHNLPCYELLFGSGETVIADCDHQWLIGGSVINTVQLMEKHRSSGEFLKLPCHEGEPPMELIGISQVESVPTQCIQVEAVDSLYRIGVYAEIVTHNTGLTSGILGGHLIGPEAIQNSQIKSAARSRDQAALVFNYLAKSLRMRNDLEGLVQITDSGKKIVGLARNVEYKAISADATTAHGLSPALAIHDELGQVVGPVDALYDAIETAGGAYESPLSLIISTQAASDTDLMSIIIDDALRNPTPENIVHLYAAAKNADIWDPRVWKEVNFALGTFRSEKEFKEAADRAKRMPSFEAAFRNLYLNQRVSLLQLLVSPTVWAANGGDIDDSLFTSGEPVYMAADLSKTTDLTAVVLACRHPETQRVHLKCFVYTPLDTLEERAKVDRAPYKLWVEQGHLIALPGKVLNYDMIVQHLKMHLDGVKVTRFLFDRWRMDSFKKACIDGGFLGDMPEDAWTPIGQGYRDMTICIEAMETLLLQEELCHGNNPVLTMGSANAIVVSDPAGNRKLEKSKSSARIDPFVAAVMAVRGFSSLPLDGGQTQITESSMFFV